jgi:serine/threonine-protein kinase
LFHSHIVGIHDRGEFEGQLWLSMDYLDGTDAAELLHSRYPFGMPSAEAFTIISAIADALDYAHQRGLLHRDIKPANILLSDTNPRGRRILLADFGIARQVADISGLTATNMVMRQLQRRSGDLPTSFRATSAQRAMARPIRSRRRHHQSVGEGPR